MIETRDLPQADTDVTQAFSVALCNLVLDLGSEGYKCRAPNREVDHIDRTITEWQTCSRCGCRGLHYEPFYNTGTGSYRAFTVCQKCGKVREF